MNEAKAVIPIGSKGIELSSFDELYRFSKFVIEAGLAPRSIDTAEKVFLAIQYSMEMGFTPMVGLQNAMVINNRVSFYGELVVAQIQAHPEFEDMTVAYSGEGMDLTCTVTIVRKNRTPSVGTFSIRQAQHLINDPSKANTWGKYPRRMLFWRAFSLAKVIFSDATKGITIPSDIEDETPQPANVLSVTKPTFQNENKPDETTGTEVAGTASDQQPNGAGAGESPLDGTASPGHGGPEGRAGLPGEIPLPSDSDAPSQKEPRAAKRKTARETKADKLIALVNKDGFASSDVVDFLDACNLPLETAKTSGLVHDLPEDTLSQALQQWESIRYHLAKAKE